MKRGFGILFIIIGAINIIIGVMGLGSRFQDEAIAKLMFGFASLALGWWMVNSSNNSKSDDVKTKEKVQTSYKTDNSLQNLSDLKEKGILTDEEYNQKVNKINAEKDEQELKNSVEYKQLKSLLDSNILTKEEFESKVSLLQTKAEEVSNIIIQKTTFGYRVELKSGKTYNLTVINNGYKGNIITGDYNSYTIKYGGNYYNYQLLFSSQKILIKINNEKLYFKNTEEFIEYLVLQHLQ